MKFKNILAAALISAIGASAFGAPEQNPAAKSSGLIWMVKDLDSKQVLSENLVDASFNPQDAVRLMTFYTALKTAAGRSDDLMKVQLNAKELEPALKEKGRVIAGIDPKDEPHIEVLLRLVATVGAEDAAILLADKVSGSVPSFVAAMNHHARALHMDHSLFSSPISAPEQRTTAGDLLLLIRALREEFPEESGYFAENEFSFDGKTLKNPLTVVNPDEKSLIPLSLNQCCMIAGIWTKAEDKELPARELHFVFVDQKEYKRVIDQASKVVTKCQTEFESIELYDAGTVISKIPVVEGEQPSVGIMVAKPVRITLPRKELIENGIKSIEIKLEHVQEIAAPVQKGRHAGILKIHRNGKLLAQYEAVTAEDVNRLNFFERIIQKKNENQKAND
jgi:D-alanyl-D-alanine carboxypeptidase (penicillin-binding protein 5/6)